MKTSDLVVIGAGVAVLGVAFYVWKKGGIAGAAAGAVGAVAGAAGDAVAGVSEGLGDLIGIPRTDQTECEKAIAEGRTLDASFACPAGTFLKNMWDSAVGNTPDDPNQTAAETARLYRYNRAADNGDAYQPSSDAQDYAGAWG